MGAAAFPEDHTAVSLRQVGEARSHRGHQANCLAAAHRAEEHASVGRLQGDTVDAGQGGLQDTPHHAGISPPEQVRLEQQRRSGTAGAGAR